MKRKFLFALCAIAVAVSVLFGPVSVPPAYAEAGSSALCPNPPEGKKYVLYGITDTEAFPPFFSNVKCVLLNQGAQKATFEDLVNADLFLISEAETRVYSEWRNTTQDCNTTTFQQLGSDGYSLAQNTGYYTSFTGTCQKDGTPTEPVFRYKFVFFDRPHVFLYPTTRVNEGEVTTQGNCPDLDQTGCPKVVNCFWQGSNAEDQPVNMCQSKLDRSICATLPYLLCGTEDGSPACAWNVSSNRCISALEQDIANQNKKGDFQSALPPCAFEGTCDDLNYIVQTAVNYAKSLFGFLGVFAFCFFVYGGVTILTSFGNAERLKKGRDTLGAAILGIIICFSAYAVINLVLDALKVGDAFRVIR